MERSSKRGKKVKLLLITWEASFEFDIRTPESPASDLEERKQLPASKICPTGCKWKHRPCFQKDRTFQGGDSRDLTECGDGLSTGHRVTAQEAQPFQHWSRPKWLNFPQHHCLTHMWGRGKRRGVLGLVSCQPSAIKHPFRNDALVPSSSRCPLVTFLVMPS